MTTTIDPRMAWLTQICDGSDDVRELVTRPWGIMIAGEPWTVATDGHRMVAVRWHYGFDQADEEDEERLRKWSAKTYPRGAARGTIDLAALRRFLDEQRKPNPCGDCNGTGAQPCECYCGHKHDALCWRCKGEGLGFVWVDGALFNASLWATPLRRLDGERAEFLHDPTDWCQVAVIKTDDWMVAVMPLHLERVDADRKAKAPTFPFGEAVAA